MKKVLAVLLCIMMILPTIGTFSSFAYGETIKSLSFNVYDKAEDSIDTIKWFQRDDKYYMFLPSNTDLKNIKVYFNASGEVYVNGTEIKSGEATSVFETANTEYTLTCGTKSYKIVVLCSAEIPAVYITTESGSLNYIHSNKENKEPGNIRIYENGKQTLNSALKQIKGRGNSTWGLEKKPYNIKFDKKTDLFGMGKAKKWTLLANHYDRSLIRNIAAYELAQRIGLPYTCLYQPVDLYINGTYLGNYLVTESVEVGTTRVDINDLEKDNEDANPGVDLETLSTGSVGDQNPGSRKWVNIPNNPENITGGYLLEFDYQNRYNAEISGFETNRGQNVTVKSPELASKAEVEYIAEYYQQAEDALASTSGYNSLGKHYTEYFDMDSFVNMYILEELTQDIDGGQTSFYLCKDKDNDKFYVAPAWDFDNTLGNDRILSEKVTLSLTDPNTWFVNQNYYSRRDDFTWTQSQIECFFTLAYENQADLRAAVRAQWSEFKKVFNDEFVSFCSAWGERIAPSAVMNNIRWNLTSLNYGEAMAKHMDYANRVTTFLVNKRTALDKGFAENAAIIYYNSNGGIGKVVDGTMYLIGDTVKVKSPDYNIYYALEAPSYDVVFNSWNTAADGSGESYKPGDTITFTSDEIHLYAIWKDPFHQDDNHKVSFWQKIVNFFRKIGDWFAKLFR